MATCTDVKQTWGKLKKNAAALYEVIPVKRFCHGAQKPPLYKMPKLTAEHRKKFLNLVIEGSPNCEIAKLKRQYRSNPLPEAQISLISKEDCRQILDVYIRPMLTDETVLFSIKQGSKRYQNTLKNLPEEQQNFFKNKV